jgi:hypothetical protein
MKPFLRKVILGTLLGLSVILAGETAARADDYWKHYWRWYDRTYRPYFHRRYFNAPPPPPAYYYPPAPPGPNYYGGGGYTTYYGPAYPYYGSVVGPMRYGWW